MGVGRLRLGYLRIYKRTVPIHYAAAPKPTAGGSDCLSPVRGDQARWRMVKAASPSISPRPQKPDAKPETGSGPPPHRYDAHLDRSEEPAFAMSTIPYPVRMWAILIVFGLLGFVFPYFWILAGVGAWGLLTDKPIPPEDTTPLSPVARWPTLTPDDPDWVEGFQGLCESPAETAFLDAMIGDFGLKPDRGVLRGGGIAMQLQVKFPPYRVDFLVDGWLVVEIDGAAYHSSPEQSANDAKRDAFLQGLGLTVLRITARAVFQTPGEALRAVKASLRVGKGTPSANSQETKGADVAPKQPWSLNRFVEGINRATEDLNRYVSAAAAEQAALSEPELAFHAERVLINSGFEHAKRQVEHEEFKSRADDATRRYYEEAHARLTRILQEQEPRPIQKVEVRPFRAPAVHPDPDIAQRIQSAFQNLVEQRKAFLEDARARLRADPKIRPLVQGHIEKLGDTSVWKLIA